MSKKLITFYLVAGLILSLTSSTWAGFRVLDNYRGVCAQSNGAAPGCGNKGGSSGSDWGGYVQDIRTANAINDSAARDLEYLASILGTLDDYSRSLLASELTDNERTSVNTAYQAVTQRFENALALNRSIRAKIGALESQKARLQSRLLELEKNKNTALAQIVNIKTGIASLREQITRTKERLAWAEQDASVAENLARSSVLTARAARKSYWSLASAYFDQHNLGMPRDFMPEVEVASAYAQRRRIVNSPSIASPFALQSMPIVARAAIVPAPVAAQAAAPTQIDRNAFLRLMGQWRNTLDSTHRLQIKAENLADTAQDSARLIDQKAAQVADLQDPLDAGRREENALKIEAAALQVKLERAVTSGQASLSELFNSSKEMLVWQLAEESIKRGLSPIASMGALVSLGVAVGQGYKTLFEDDIPAVISLMGQNPSDEAIEKIQSLRFLTEEKGTYILSSTYFGALSEMPELNASFKINEGAKAKTNVWLADEIPERNTRLKLRKIAPEIKTENNIEMFELSLPGGTKFAGDDLNERLKPGFNSKNDAITQLKHAISHTTFGKELNLKPFAQKIEQRIAEGEIDHTVIDVPPLRLLDLYANLEKRVKTGEGVMKIKPTNNKRNRTYVLIEMKNIIGRTGIDWQAPNPKSTGVPTKRLLLILNYCKDTIINLYPVEMGYKIP